MADYTKELLQGVVDNYADLGQISDWKKFTSGTDNTNFYVRTPKGEFVLKIYDGMNLSSENVFFELEVMECSSSAGVKTPRVLKTKDSALWVKTADRYAMMMDYVEAENMKGREVSDGVVYETGIEVGKMDVALSIFKDEGKTRRDYIFDPKNFLANEKSIALLPEAYSKELFQDIVNNYKEKQVIISSLPAGIIHNDITLHNLLVKGNNLEIIIDFSDIAYAPYVQNIAVAMSQLIFTYNWKPHQAAIFMKGYEQSRKLSSEEFDLLYLFVLMRYTTLVVEFNRWNVESGETESSKKLVVDSYKFMQDFIRFGKDQFDSVVRSGRAL